MIMSECYAAFSRANHLLAALQPHLCRFVGKRVNVTIKAEAAGDKRRPKGFTDVILAMHF